MTDDWDWTQEDSDCSVDVAVRGGIVSYSVKEINKHTFESFREGRSIGKTASIEQAKLRCRCTHFRDPFVDPDWYNLVHGMYYDTRRLTPLGDRKTQPQWLIPARMKASLLRRLARDAMFYNGTSDLGDILMGIPVRWMVDDKKDTPPLQLVMVLS